MICRNAAKFLERTCYLVRNDQGLGLGFRAQPEILRGRPRASRCSRSTRMPVLISTDCSITPRGATLVSTLTLTRTSALRCLDRPWNSTTKPKAALVNGGANVAKNGPQASGERQRTRKFAMETRCPEGYACPSLWALWAGEDEGASTKVETLPSLSISPKPILPYQS